MTTYSAGRCDSVSSGGCVRIELRFSIEDMVISCLSPAGARYMARTLLELADDAEAWRAPDEPLREPAPLPKPRRKARTP